MHFERGNYCHHLKALSLLQYMDRHGSLAGSYRTAAILGHSDTAVLHLPLSCLTTELRCQFVDLC